MVRITGLRISVLVIRQQRQPAERLGRHIQICLVFRSAGHGMALIPITESGRVVGIVSVQNLMSSMSLLAEQRRLERQESGD